MKKIEVVCAVIKKDNKVFCCKRGPGRELEGFYEFPGGKIELNETKEAALHREIEEELTTEININRYITTVDYDYSTFHLTMHAFLCEIIKGDLTLSEHTDKKWLTEKDIILDKFAPADRLVITELLKQGI